MSFLYKKIDALWAGAEHKIYINCIAIKFIAKLQNKQGFNIHVHVYDQHHSVSKVFVVKVKSDSIYKTPMI
jgi:hypothetical protein